MAKNQKFAARPRSDVQADLKARGSWAQFDCRGEKWDNPNTSSAMYGLTSARYDALGIRSPKAARTRKQREARWVESTFRTTGNFEVETRKGGRW